MLLGYRYSFKHALWLVKSIQKNALAKKWVTLKCRDFGSSYFSGFSAEISSEAFKMNGQVANQFNSPMDTEKRFRSGYFTDLDHRDNTRKVLDQ